MQDRKKHFLQTLYNCIQYIFHTGYSLQKPRRYRVTVPAGFLFYAGGGTRTHTPLRITDFESVSSASSDTPANRFDQLCSRTVLYTIIFLFIFQLFFITIFQQFFPDVKAVECCEIVCRCLGTPNQLYRSILFQKQFC